MKRMKVKALKKKSIWANLKLINPIFLAACVLVLVCGVLCLYLALSSGSTSTTTQSSSRNFMGRGLTPNMTVIAASALTIISGVVGLYASTKKYKLPALVGFSALSFVMWGFALIGSLSGGFDVSRVLMFIAGLPPSFLFAGLSIYRNGLLPRKNEDEMIY